MARQNPNPVHTVRCCNRGCPETSSRRKFCWCVSSSRHRRHLSATTETAALTVSPNGGVPGTTDVTLTGSGFAAGETVHLCANSTDFVRKSVLRRSKPAPSAITAERPAPVSLGCDARQSSSPALASRESRDGKFVRPAPALRLRSSRQSWLQTVPTVHF